MTEEVKETKPENKQVTDSKFKKFMKDMLDLEPIFVNKIGPALKPHAKIVYYILSVILLLSALTALLSLGFTAFVLIAISFVIVRMFAEYLQNN